MPYILQRWIALVTVVVAAPTILLEALVIRVLDGPPVLFRQERVGVGRKRFEILKFRTMVKNADDLLGTEAATTRVTRTGRILRKTGLDELPQLVNVVRGDMAIVGPRAMLPEVASSLPSRYLKRFEVLPGITGLAQVSGRNAVPWSKRLELDLRYVAERSARLDLQILLKTAVTLLAGKGHSPDRNTSEVDDLGLLRNGAKRP